MSATNESAVTSTSSTGGTVAAAADWSTSLVRYFLLDPTGGNDGNVGYIDAAAGTTLVPSGLAKKTIAGIMAILPLLGSDRSAVVLQMPGTLTEDLVLSPLAGYRLFMWRGSTDLTNTFADRTLCGFVTVVAGPGGSGEFTVTAGATTTTIPIAAGSFGAEPAALQYRVRFLANTTTVALRNLCRPITAHTTTVLTTGVTMPAAPASGDTFVIERPGAVVAKVRVETAGLSGSSLEGGRPSALLIGIGFTGSTQAAFNVSGPNISLVGIEGTASTTINTAIIQSGGVITTDDVYIDEAIAVPGALGMGFRSQAPMICRNWTQATLGLLGLMHTTTASTFQSCRSITLGAKSYFAKGPTVSGMGAPGADLVAGGSRMGDFSTITAQPRINAGTLALLGCSLFIRRIDFQNTGAVPAIKVSGTGNQITIDGCTGSSGNTDVGIDLTASIKGVVKLGTTTANTVTGTAGDIRLAGPAIASHTDLALTNVVDSAGNSVQGTALAVVDQCVLVSNQSGGALAVGNTVRSNGTTGQVTSTTGNSATIGDSHIVGVMVTSPASASPGYMAVAGAPYTLFDGAPTAGAIAYLSPGTAGKLTTTVPAIAANNNKLRVGRTLTALGSTGRSLLAQENLAIVADGAA
jgi:hypothetical protein